MKAPSGAFLLILKHSNNTIFNLLIESAKIPTIIQNQSN